MWLPPAIMVSLIKMFYWARSGISNSKAIALLVRPEFTDTLAISDGRHPIKELFDAEDDEFIPKYVFLFFIWLRDI